VRRKTHELARNRDNSIGGYSNQPVKSSGGNLVGKVDTRRAGGKGEALREIGGILRDRHDDHLPKRETEEGCDER